MKLTRIIIMLSLFVITLGLSSCKSSETVYWYVEYENGYEISKIELGNEKVLEIPKAYKDKPVLAIGGYAFVYTTAANLQTLIIPEGIKSIGNGFLDNCDTVKKVQLPSTLEEIGEGFLCRSLVEEIEIARNTKYKTVDGVLYTSDMQTLIKYPTGKNLKSYNVYDGVKTIGETAFFASAYLEKITLPDSVTRIGEEAFRYANSLVELKLPESLEKIEEAAIADCASLTELTIPDKVESLEKRVVYSGKSLEMVTLGVGVSNICDGALSNNENLKRIKVDDENKTFASLNGHLVSKDVRRLIRCVSSFVGEEYNIPDGIEVIGAYACSQNSTITRLVISDSVKRVEKYAFYDCEKLSEIIIGSGTEFIGECAFGGENELKKVFFKETSGWDINISNPIDNVNIFKSSNGYHAAHRKNNK